MSETKNVGYDLDGIEHF